MNIEMKEWLEKGYKAGEFVNSLSEITPNPAIDYKVGDIVDYTNDYGVTFKGLKIIAIGKLDEIYLEKDSYWYPVKLENITLAT